MLTAAHCVYGCTDFLICVGNGVTYDTSCCFYQNDLSKVCVHREFHEAAKNKQFYSDIATIRINDNFFKACPTNIALARFCTMCPNTTCDSYTETSAKIIGCGETENHTLSNHMREADQRVLPQSEGFSKFTKLFPAFKYKLCFTKSATSDQRISSCAGDSGSPLMFQNPVTNTLEVCGLVSFGTANCTTGEPSAYTYLPPYRNFIFWDHECVTLAAIKNKTANVQATFGSYSVYMRPRSEAIWEGQKQLASDHDNTLKPTDHLSVHDVDYPERVENKLSGFQLFFKAVSNFFQTLALG